MLEHAAKSGLEDFVTGLVGRVDLRTGSLDLVNAGHVVPYLARGEELVGLDLYVDLPLGLFGDTAYRTSRVDLEPGDRIVLLTDGMLERNAVNVDLPGRSGKPGRCTRARRYAPWPTGSSRRPTTHSATTPRCCAWTGTATMGGTGSPAMAPNRAALPRSPNARTPMLRTTVRSVTAGQRGRHHVGHDQP